MGYGAADEIMTKTFTFRKAAGALPVIGHIFPMLKNPLAFVASLPVNGDLVEIRIGYIKAIVVCHPELIHQVLLDDRTFDKGGPFYRRAREIGGNGVASCPRSDHRQQRRRLQPAFQQDRLCHYAHMMTEEITRVTDSWRDGQTIDLETGMLEITLGILTRTMFAAPLQASGAKASHLDDIDDTVRVVLTGLYRRMLIPSPFDRIPTRNKRRYDRARARLRQITSQYVAEYRQMGIDHRDLLSILSSARNGDRLLSDTEIGDQVTTLFIGATETTAATLRWALWQIARNPDVERRLHHEVDGALAGRAVATWDDLPNLTYTRRIINEALRMYPPIWMLTRSTTVDTQLGGHSIPAGTTLVFSPYLFHHHPDLWTEPDRFDPDRWPDEETARPPRGTFVPFGGGARRCIGDVFGMTEAILTLASMTSRWRFEPSPDADFGSKPMATLAPARPRMRLVARV